MTERTFSMGEVYELIPELGKQFYTRACRNIQFLSDTAQSVSGSGNYRQYTLIDVAVLRAACDLDALVGRSGGPLRRQILEVVSGGQHIDVEIGGFRIQYEPRWVTEEEVQKITPPPPSVLKRTSSDPEQVECLVCHEAVIVNRDGRLRFHGPIGHRCLGSRRPVSWLPEDDLVAQ